MRTSRVRTLARYIDKQGQVIGGLFPAILEKPKGSRVHALRVATRRLRASLWLLRHSEPQLKFSKFKKKLRSIGRIAGELRALDVAVGDAEKFEIKHSSLKKLRKKTRKKFIVVLKEFNIEKMLSEIDKVASDVAEAPDFDFARALAGLRRRLMPLRYGHTSLKRLHQLRIEVKKTRYVLEALGRPVHPLRVFQGWLGRVHDIEVLEDRALSNSRTQRDRAECLRKSNKLAGPALRFAFQQLADRRSHHVPTKTQGGIK